MLLGRLRISTTFKFLACSEEWAEAQAKGQEKLISGAV